MNDNERENWCLNDESLYLSGYSRARNKRQWIRENRDFIDEVIKAHGAYF